MAGVARLQFGAKKIPELATSLGKGLRKFKDAKDGLEDQLKTVMKEPVEALQAAKSQFDQHLADAQVPIRDAAKSLESNVPGVAPVQSLESTPPVIPSP